MHALYKFTFYTTLHYVVVVTPNCSFPFTYNGALYYSCITDMTGVSTNEHPYACINVNATPVVCETPGATLISMWSNL